MKALTLWQPWPSLIAEGVKHYETRSWPTHYRGPIAIHASKKPFRQILRELFPLGNWDYAPDFKAKAEFLATVEKHISVDSMPYGAIVATAQLVECWECIGPDQRGDLMIWRRPNPGASDKEWESAYVDGEEVLFGNFEKGRYAWELADIKKLDKPIPIRGGQGLWDCPVGA
jgi:hypothetical protein